MSEHALVMDQQGETEPGEPYADERSATMYAELCKHLPTFEKNRLSYLKQGQVIGRLNAVLGFDGWSFEIVEHGYREDADELWVRGRLTVYGPRRTVIREQFGSQKHNRLRDGKTIIDLGFDLKGATSDSFKKCCQAIGIGLWLASDEEAAEPVAEKAPPADNRVACEGCLKLVERVSINMGKCTSCRSIADKQRREREAAEAAAKKPASPTVPVQDARQKLGLPAEKQPTPIDSEPPVVTQVVGSSATLAPKPNAPRPLGSKPAAMAPPTTGEMGPTRSER